MPMLIFVNLPVADIAASTTFYEAVGATKNPMFSDATTACMVFSDTIHVMLLDHARYATFTRKRIVDAHRESETLTALSADSRADVDAVLARAIAAGGREDTAATQDYGFMYGRRFEDPDGHSIDIMWMDVDAAQSAMAPQGDQEDYRA